MNPVAKTSRSRRLLILMILFLVALGVRSFRAMQEPVVNPDAIRFIEQAQGLASDPLRAIRAEVYHPLHSAAGLVVHGLIQPFFADDVAGARAAWLAAMQVVGIIAGSVVALEIVALARLLGARFWPAVAAAMVWIVGRRTSAYGADGLSDMLFIALFAGGMIAGFHALRFRTKHAASPRRRVAASSLGLFFLSGLLAGLAYLTRPEGLGVPLILLGTICLLALPRRRREASCAAPSLVSGLRLNGAWSWAQLRRRFKLFPWRRLPVREAVLGACWLLCGVAIPAAPYMVAIHGITGKKPLLVASAEVGGPADGVAAAGGRRGAAGDGRIGAGGPEVRLVTGPALGAPAPLMSFRDDVYTVAMELWETFGFAPMLIFLLAIPLAPRFWGRPRLRLPVMIWTILWYTVMFWLVHRAGYLDGRHTLPLQLLAHSLLALAFVVWSKPMQWWINWYRWRGVWAGLPAWRRWRGWPGVLTAGAALLAMLPGVLLLVKPPLADRLFIRQAADWVAAKTVPGALICDRERLVGYYSGHPFKLWEGSADNPELGQISAARAAYPHIIIALTYLPGRGDPPRDRIGPYRAIAAFQSPTAEARDVLVLYALPDDPVLLSGPAPILTRLP